MTRSTLPPRLLLLSATVLLAACDPPKTPKVPSVPSVPAAPSASPTAGKEVARVNGVAITEWDVKLLSSRGAHGADPEPGKERRVLDTIVRQELVRQAAVKLGLDREEALTRELAMIKARAAAMERRALHQAYMNREVQQKAEVTDEQARTHWEKNQAALKTTVHVLQIRRRTREAILKAEADLKAGKTFEQVARDRPDLKGKALQHKYWDLGFLRWTQLPPSWRAVLPTLKDGELSEVVQGRGDRYWILKVVARGEDSTMTFKDQADAIKEALKRDQLEARRKQVLEVLRKDAKIEISL